MITIDLNKIREALPSRAKVKIGKTDNCLGLMFANGLGN